MPSNNDDYVPNQIEKKKRMEIDEIDSSSSSSEEVIKKTPSGAQQV